MHRKRAFHLILAGWSVLMILICIAAITRPDRTNTEPGKKKMIIRTIRDAKTFHQRLEKAIKGLIGTRYKYGGTGKRGVDCSGAVYYCWKVAGKPIPRMSARKMHALYGKKRHYRRSKKFDLIWWTFSLRWPYGHIGIMDGDQKHFWHSSRRRGFCREKIKKGLYWDRFFADTGKIE